MAPDKGKQRPPEEDLLDWFTITYRSIYVAVLLLVALAAAGLYFYFYYERPPSPAVV